MFCVSSVGTDAGARAPGTERRHENAKSNGKMCGGAHLLGSLRLRGRLMRDSCSEGARGVTLTMPWAAAAVGFAAAAMVCYAPLGVLGKNWCARGSWLGRAPSRGQLDVRARAAGVYCNFVPRGPRPAGVAGPEGAVGGHRLLRVRWLARRCLCLSQALCQLGTAQLASFCGLLPPSPCAPSMCHVPQNTPNAGNRESTKSG